MTNYNQTTNNIGNGIRYNYAAAGDTYRVFEDVRVESLDSSAISGNQGNQSLLIEGLVKAVYAAAYLQGNNNFVHISSTAVLSSSATSYSSVCLWIGGAQSSIINDGKIVAQGVAAFASDGANVSLENNGAIIGGTGVLAGLFGGAGQHIENTGLIKATRLNDSVGDRYTHGIISEGDDTTIVNEKSGKVVATASQGAAVAIGSTSFGGDGSTVMNRGSLVSEKWYGVDFSYLPDSDEATLTNNGTIQGMLGSFRGNAAADIIENVGVMIGDVTLNGGDDVFKGTNGTLRGDIIGGTGDDYLATGNGGQHLFGGTENDILVGGKGGDKLSGEAGIDTFVFKTGFGKDTIMDFAMGDFINVRGWKAISDFADLKRHADDHGQDTWIVSGKDTLIIKGLNESELEVGSFIL